MHWTAVYDADTNYGAKSSAMHGILSYMYFKVRNDGRTEMEQSAMGNIELSDASSLTEFVLLLLWAYMTSLDLPVRTSSLMQQLTFFAGVQLVKGTRDFIAGSTASQAGRSVKRLLKSSITSSLNSIAY